LQFALDPYYAQVAETYADAKPGELIIYEDSYGAMAIAVRDGNAARLTGAAPGDRVRVRVTAAPE
jgi:S-adenosylmethionine hydrolase